MIKLDDFLSKKKEPAQVLDLSKIKITSKDEFKKYYDKIPESKMKPEKIPSDLVKIKEKDFTFTGGKKEEKNVREWNYPDPTPPDMKGVKLEDLCPINIDWKMLTTIRPKSKVEEDMFSRLVQLGKLDLKYQQSLQREKSTDWIRRTKNPKSSLIEMRVISCKECGEDFCDGSLCSKLTYENFFRPQPTTSNINQNMSLLAAEAEGKTMKKKRKKKRRQKKKDKTGDAPKRIRRKKLGKTSIFNRPTTSGCTRDHFRRKGEEVVEKYHPRVLNTTRSFSCERRQISFMSTKRSKSAPRIHFDRDTSDSEFRRSEYLSDSAPSNTDYSSQSDSESPDRQFFLSPRLRLSGRRKLLSARVSFSDRKQRRESAQSSRMKFVRQCTLFREEGGKFGTTSESSSPARSKSISKSPKKYSRSPASLKPPSTIRIQFDDECSDDEFTGRIAWPMCTPSNVISRRNLIQKREIKSGNLLDGIPKLEFDPCLDPEITKPDKKSKSKKFKLKLGDSHSDSSAAYSCLKAKCIFRPN